MQRTIALVMGSETPLTLAAASPLTLRFVSPRHHRPSPRQHPYFSSIPRVASQHPKMSRPQAKTARSGIDASYPKYSPWQSRHRLPLPPRYREATGGIDGTRLWGLKYDEIAICARRDFNMRRLWCPQNRAGDR